MKLKPIRNDRELNRALKRIDELWGAKSNTQRGDQVFNGAKKLVTKRSRAVYRNEWMRVRGAE